MSGGPHNWSYADDVIVALWVAGKMTCVAAAKHVGVAEPSIRFRARRLGLTQGKLPPLKSHTFSAHPMPGDPWVPIAHGSNGRWRLYDGAPVTVHEAQTLVALGRAITAQRRIDGKFDLLFKVLA